MIDTTKKICEIGCGDEPIFTSSVRVDIRKTLAVSIIADACHLPFKEEIFDHVYSSHTIEHFSHNNVPYVLKEWVRIIKPGGVIEIRCPDLRARALIFFLKPTFDNIHNIYGKQDYPENYHQTGFSYRLLKSLLIENGIIDIKRVLDGYKGVPFLPCDLHIIGKKSFDKTKGK